MRFRPGFDLVGTCIVAGVLTAVLVAETARPLRPRRRPRALRWATNAGYGALAAILVRGAIVPAMDACTRWAARRGGGVLRWLPLPAPLGAVTGIVALDYSMYLWHRALHGSDLLWRFHCVHHADVDLDASTALRFQLGELLASLPFRCAQVVLLGVSPRLALSYELAMQAAAVFHHSNTRLPVRLERVLGWLVVTPRMHGVHHSVETHELSSNWSVVFSFWDRLHGTHRSRDEQPAIGLAPENDPRRVTRRGASRPRPSRAAG